MRKQIKIKIVQIGSSKGIRIPKRVLDRLGMSDSAVAIITNDSITLKASDSPRIGWEEDFKRCGELGMSR